jgi:hypothetical protein
MNKIIRKSLLLFAAITALAAFAVPMASAANWSPLNSYQITTSPTAITIDVPTPPYTQGLSCSSGPTLATHVRTPGATLMDVLAGLNFSCVGTGLFATCTTADLIPTGMPWTVDGTSTTNVKINSLSINGTLTGGACGAGAPFTLSGTLVGGQWSNTTHSLAFTNATGLMFTMGATSAPATLSSSKFINDPLAPFIGLP